MRRSDGEHIEGVRLNGAGNAGIAFDDQRHAVADDVSERGCKAASIGHDLQFDAGAAFQQQASQMR
jgi:hypothetical protein